MLGMARAAGGASEEVLEAIARFSKAAKLARSADEVALIADLAAKGIKHTPDNIVAISRNAKGAIVFLETGTEAAGLHHILKEHGADFIRRGICEADIPKAVMQDKKVAGTVYRTMRGSAADLWRLCADGRQDDSRYFASQEAKAAIKSRFRLP